MTHIFISYRRNVGPTGFPEQLRSRLAEEFGTSRVFLDREGISAGQNFESCIEQEIRKCNVFLVVLVKSTLDRVDQPGDWVRREIALALKQPHVLVIPLLVDEFTMPAEKDLPPDIRELAKRNGVHLSSDPKIFRSTVNQLINEIKTGVRKKPSRMVIIGAILGLLAILLVVLAVLTALPASSPSEGTPTTTEGLAATSPDQAATILAYVNNPPSHAVGPTPNVSEREAQIEQVIATAAEQSSPIFGPMNGSFSSRYDSETGRIWYYDQSGGKAYVSLRNFVARVTFALPQPMTHKWRNAISFRSDPTGETRGFSFNLESDGTWQLTEALPSPIYGPDVTSHPVRNEGRVSLLNTDADSENTLTLIAFEAWGYVWINDIFVTTLDLSGQAAQGDVAVIAMLGVDTQDPVTETTIGYTDFTLEPLNGCFVNASEPIALFSGPTTDMALSARLDVFSAPVAAITHTDGDLWLQVPGPTGLAWVNATAVDQFGACDAGSFRPLGG